LSNAWRSPSLRCARAQLSERPRGP
jgi:hypothetical protein